MQVLRKKGWFVDEGKSHCSGHCAGDNGATAHGSWCDILILRLSESAAAVGGYEGFGGRKSLSDRRAFYLRCPDERGKGFGYTIRTNDRIIGR